MAPKFIDTNIGTESFDRSQRRAVELDSARQTFDNREQAETERRNVDTVARQAAQGNQPGPAPAGGSAPSPFESTGPASPLRGVNARQASQPVRTDDLPGTGAFQLGRQDKAQGRQDTLNRQDDARTDAAGKQAMAALMDYAKTGNPASYQAFKQSAAQAGMQFDDGALEDTQNAGELARAMMLADRWYKADEGQAQRFIQTLLESDDLATAIEVAGVPVDKPRLTKVTLLQDGKQFLGTLDTNTGAVTNTGYEVPASGGARGGTPKDQQMVEFLVANKIAATAQEAWQLVSTAKTNPMESWRKFYDAARERLEFQGEVQLTPEQLDEAATKAADMFIRRFGFTRPGAPAATAPAAAKPRVVGRGEGGNLGGGTAKPPAAPAVKAFDPNSYMVN